MKALMPILVLALPWLITVAAAGQASSYSARAEKRYSITLDAPEGRNYCHARISTTYLQRNTTASVEGSLENPDCGPSFGEFTMSVRIRDESGELRTVEHIEQWQRDDDRKVEFVREYPIGENVDLVRVRASKIVCICAGNPATADSDNKQGEENE